MSKLTNSQSKLSAARQTAVDTTRQMWMAGLGAFVKTGQEGGRLFSSLVEEGEKFQDKVTSKTSNQVSDTLDSVMTKTSGQWDKLEAVLEDRVIRILDKLGVPNKEDINELLAKINELQAAVEAAEAGKAPAARAKKAPPAATSKPETSA